MRVVLAGGGSGGHVYPALAIIEALGRCQPDGVEVLYIGTQHGLEARVVPEHGITFAPIQARGILGKGLKQKAGAAILAVSGFFEALRLLRRFRCDVVIGTGGYVTGPVGLAAVALGVPLIIQEQNVWPGVTNRVLARFAKLIFSPYEQSRPYFPRGANLMVVANPVSAPIGESREQARMRLGLKLESKLLMVTGGSQGAWAINRWILSILPEMIQREDFGLLWATGPRYFERIQNEIGERKLYLDPRRIQVQAYFDEISRCYRASDLFLGRAGAMTITDCLAYGLPMVLVPSPNVAEDHQTRNAQALEEAGVALMVTESQLGEVGLSRVFRLLADEGARIPMHERAKSLFDPGAADKMARMVALTDEAVRREKARGRR